MCTHPIRLRAHTERSSTVPCGFCIECRTKYRRDWALRCMHEASLHSESCFGTLTYDDEHLPKYGSLDREAFPLFMKRLRKSLGDRKVRYYHAGEYGEDNGRPHYHFLLFGFAFPDRYLAKEGEFPLYRSPALEKLWPAGLSSIGDVSYASASYVAGYVMKKVDRVGRKPRYNVDSETGEMVEIEPEYSTMSRGGRCGRGLGFGWFERYGSEVYRADSVVQDGQEVPVPRYYDDLLRASSVAEFEAVKARRVARHRLGESFRERSARAAIAASRLALSERKL